MPPKMRLTMNDVGAAGGNPSEGSSSTPARRASAIMPDLGQNSDCGNNDMHVSSPRSAAPPPDMSSIAASSPSRSHADLAQLVERATSAGNEANASNTSDGSGSFAVAPVTTPFIGTIRNGVAWDTARDIEARPVSTKDFETIRPGSQGSRYKCLCGERKGGKRVSTRHPKRHEYKGPTFTFDAAKGFYNSETFKGVLTPFHALDTGSKVIYCPITYTLEDFKAGKKVPSLSHERTVVRCAHFPVTGLKDYNPAFVKGRVAEINDTTHDIVRVEDQARRLCLIEDEYCLKSQKWRRRMNIHAPPVSWNDPALISVLNRWRAQFRQRKLGEASRPKREPWAQEQLDYLTERLARKPTVYRPHLAEDITEKFGIRRTDHAISCAIDNHKIKDKAEALRKEWAAQGLIQMFGDDDEDDYDDSSHENSSPAAPARPPSVITIKSEEPEDVDVADVPDVADSTNVAQAAEPTNPAAAPANVLPASVNVLPTPASVIPRATSLPLSFINFPTAPISFLPAPANPSPAPAGPEPQKSLKESKLKEDDKLIDYDYRDMDWDF